ncbi:helix-turn-helix transcriptional regulator [Chryseobacterium sp. APV1]|uniref:Helix-turn-helix transcriptional regulator n=1 Tax=Chryseobacterium urinae TaxID=3058400 RepID=A0ABT8U357_9FLAO|nr:helix-turn-helix transcriptional regulator [Chryseobacterium sp. APV1]MDO3425494.1 helix-turn-helix transcriptional regulator [Chryseobacterium sp. APV1]
MILGNRVKMIRELKNYSQKYVSERLDISQAAYSKLETGETKITDEKLNQIAEILEVKPEDIKSFDSQKYFNSNGNIEGDYSGSIIVGLTREDVELIKKLYEDRIVLLEELLNQQKKIVQKYESKYGEL